MDERERSGSRRRAASKGSDGGRARAGVVALVALVTGTLAAVVPGLVSPATALGEEPAVFATPGFYEYEVPPGVGSLAVAVAGGQGGGSWSNQYGTYQGGLLWGTSGRQTASGGEGGHVEAIIPVTPGDELGITVGAATDGRWGGFGGGGRGGHWEWDLWTGSTWVTAEADGGGGGGASSIVKLDFEDPLVVGGGGGGGGVTFFADEYQYPPDDESVYPLPATCDSLGVGHPSLYTEQGGDGGGHGGPDGADGCYKGARTNGDGATTSAPGDGRGYGDDGSAWGGSYSYGFAANGGDGAFGAGGGGGGGYYGGGGGGEDGGGGGSSYAIPEATGVVYSLNTGYHGYDTYHGLPSRGIFDGFVIITPIEVVPSPTTTIPTVTTTTALPPPSANPSDDCKDNGGERIVDNTTQGVHTMMYVDQPASDEVEVCVRVEDSSGDGVGGKLALTPGDFDPGVSGGPDTDGNSGACTDTTPNQVPGSHPMSSGGVGPVDYMIDTYADAGEAWVCLAVAPGTSTRVKIPLAAPGVTLGDPFTWYPDDGTPG